MLIITLFIMEKGGTLWHGECMRSTECLLVRHSRRQAGNALWFCQNFIFFYLFLFFFMLPPPRFPDDNF